MPRTGLTRPEIEAILAAPDRATWLGRRDYTLLLLAAQTGLRLSELISLDRDAVHLGAGAHVRCVGKGRKERCTPLTAHARGALQAWLKEPARHGANALFPICTGVYVLVAIIKKQLRLDVSLHALLQILSLTLFEKLPLKQAVAGVELITNNQTFHSQLNLFEF